MACISQRDALYKLRNILGRMEIDPKSGYYKDESIALLKDALGQNNVNTNSHAEDHSDKHKRNNMIDDIMTNKRNIATAFNNEKEWWTMVGMTLKHQYGYLRREMDVPKSVGYDERNLTLINKFENKSFRGIAKLKTGLHKVETNVVSVVVKIDSNSKSGFSLVTAFPGAVINNENYLKHKYIKTKDPNEIINNGNYTIIPGQIRQYVNSDYYKNGTPSEKLYAAIAARPKCLYKEFNCKGEYTNEEFLKDAGINKTGTDDIIFAYQPEENENRLVIRHINGTNGTKSRIELYEPDFKEIYIESTTASGTRNTYMCRNNSDIDDLRLCNKKIYNTIMSVKDVMRLDNITQQKYGKSTQRTIDIDIPEENYEADNKTNNNSYSP